MQVGRDDLLIPFAVGRQPHGTVVGADRRFGGYALNGIKCRPQLRSVDRVGAVLADQPGRHALNAARLVAAANGDDAHGLAAGECVWGIVYRN